MRILPKHSLSMSVYVYTSASRTVEHRVPSESVRRSFLRSFWCPHDTPGHIEHWFYSRMDQGAVNGRRLGGFKGSVCPKCGKILYESRAS